MKETADPFGIDDTPRDGGENIIHITFSYLSIKTYAADTS